MRREKRLGADEKTSFPSLDDDDDDNEDDGDDKELEEGLRRSGMVCG